MALIEYDHEHFRIELKDDDPFALEASLRHIYTFDYCEGVNHRLLLFHVDVAQVANKYALVDLEEKAISKFHALALCETDVHSVILILCQLQDNSVL